ncbi:hypothetical protein ACFV2U_24335 [Streptomyces sp. NPDC059697]|uniref:hypothetical protein n=1 Tax=Streptomyces sp. NPDC059697 TaxID=3346912 RepID=UPI00368B0FBD
MVLSTLLALVVLSARLALVVLSALLAPVVLFALMVLPARPAPLVLLRLIRCTKIRHTDCLPRHARTSTRDDRTAGG